VLVRIWTSLLAVAVSLAWLVGPGEGRMENDRLLTAWIAVADRADGYGYEAVVDLDRVPADARADSARWCDEMLHDDANPHRQAPRVGLHRARSDTPDLVRYEFPMADVGVELIEGRNFILVRLRVGPPLQAAQVVGWARRIVKTDRGRPDWGSLAPGTLADEARLSSDERVDPFNMPAWSSRVDAGIHKGRLFLLLYKRQPQQLGYPEGRRWFSPR
jgi:hypothetical protein